jgi:hypothetical protein
MADQPERRSRSPLYPLLLVGLVALFLTPYLFLGRSMLPLELVPVFQPWGAHAREIWSTPPPAVQNPLLDSLQQYYPRRVYMQEALRGGWLPLWNPYMYGGTPFLGSQQGAVLYPPAWVLSLLPAELQFGWSALFHLSLAALGSYLFFRRLSLRPVAAAVGAVAFAFNGFVIVWLAYPNVTQWTLCWLPLVFYLWERGRLGDLRWLGAAALALAFALLGGHGQSSLYLLLAWGAWALVRTLLGPARWRGLARGVVLPGALALLLALGHLLPTLDYVPRTDRAGRVSWESVHTAAMPPSQLWTVLLPRLFGDNTAQFAQDFWLPVAGQARLTFIERSFYPGVSVLVLGAGALAFTGRRRRTSGSADLDETSRDETPLDFRQLSLFSLGLTGVVFLLALGTALYWPFWRLVPGFGQFTAVARVLSLAAWSLACLAALGVEALASSGRVRTWATRFVGAVAVLLAVLVTVAHFIYGGAAPEPIRQYLIASNQTTADALAGRDFLVALACIAAPAIFALLGTPRGATGRTTLAPGVLGMLTLLVVAADLFAFGFSYNPASDPKLLHAETPELTFLQQQAREQSFRFLSAGPVGEEIDVRRRLPSNLPLTYGLADIDGSDSFVPLRYRQWETATRAAGGGSSPWTRFPSPNLRSAAVRYYLTSRKELQPGLTAAAGTAVQEDPQALPFARVHTNAQAMASQDDLLTALAHPNRLPLVAMTFGPDAPSFNGPPIMIPFTTRRPNGNHLVAEGSTAQSGLLVVAEQFDPGWRARVDGKAVRLFPADHLLMGVPLTPGTHRVELSYVPEVFRVGLFGTLVALGILAALLAARPHPAPPRA